MDSSQAQIFFRIARMVMIVAFGIFFICAPFIFKMTGGLLPKVGLAVLGVAIIAFEFWQWKRYKQRTE